MGLCSDLTRPTFASQRLHLERHVAPDHFLRRVNAVLNLDFVLPLVCPFYGRSGHKSLDPRVIMKLMLLLFFYDIPSERELMEQVQVRLDFLWFLGFDLETVIPDHSVPSKARARWGPTVFEALFRRTVEQCVQAGLVNGRLLHADSTMVRASVSKASVTTSGPELVQAVRQACQAQLAKLQILPPPSGGASPTEEPATTMIAPVNLALIRVEPYPVPALPVSKTEVAALPMLQVLPAVLQLPPPSPVVLLLPPAKRPVNETHLSLTDPEAALARSKNGLTEPNYKAHRLVDDAYGVITALADTRAQVPDGELLPALIEQHQAHTGLRLGPVTVAGDHHYGTAANYLYCRQVGLRPHLGERSANVAERGQFPPERFVYEPEHDRLRCPQGHYLILHQHRAEEQLKVYLIEDPQHCAQCPLRAQCTSAKQGRSLKRHVQAEVIAAAQLEAHSPAGRFSRQRRQQVMEGSFADAANNHGIKRARWRGLSRQRIQSWLIATVQNLRILLRQATSGPEPGSVSMPQGIIQKSASQVPGRPGSRRRIRDWLNAISSPRSYLAIGGCQ